MQRRTAALGALSLLLALSGCVSPRATNPGSSTATTSADERLGSALRLVEIPSSADGSLQKAYLYQAKASEPRPLVLSLHTWSGSYAQDDPLREHVLQADYHYIHPDFRGPNTTPESCASPLALSDIDDAIDYCIERFNVDSERIYVAGRSGGGHATCAVYLNSKHDIRAFHAWVPITDIEAWYYQTRQRGLEYHENITQVLGTENGFDRSAAHTRSPLHMPFRRRDGKMNLYAGIEDGYTGSVPISHSIAFFNRLCDERGRPELRISSEQTVALVTKAVPDSSDSISGRSVYFDRDADFARIVIFQGGHEMLPAYCFEAIRHDVERSD